MTNEQVKQTKPLLLWWFDKKTQTEIFPGVAFYDEVCRVSTQTRYSPRHSVLFEATGSQGEEVQFRAEVVIKKDGKFHQRKVVGEGVASKNTNGDVYVDFGPYSKTLVMGMNNE